jgi:hypothetical protein
MGHLRPKLYMYARVCRTDDPRHVGIVMCMFRWKRYGEWMANVRWLDTNWDEYVPMAMLIHAEDGAHCDYRSTC